MSCLFRALAHFVKCDHLDINENIMRNIICTYLSNNPKMSEDIKAKDFIEWENGKSLDDYVSHMQNSSSWGGAIEIKAFCNIFNSKVIVYFRDKQIEFLPGNNVINGEIGLWYTGSHFEPKIN